MKEESGYLYLIFQEKYEDQQLYKIGKTEDISRRFKEHQKNYSNSKLIISAICSNYHYTENILIKAFKENFELVKGREYFKGKHKDVRKIFINITEPYITEPYITTELSWPPLKYIDGYIENDDWKDITRKLRHSRRIMTDFYLEDLWKNSEKKEITDRGVYTYDDPKCCLCKENCTKNSKVSDRFGSFECLFKFSEEKTPDVCCSVPFCDACTSDITCGVGHAEKMLIYAYFSFAKDKRSEVKESLGDDAKNFEVDARLRKLWNELKQDEDREDEFDQYIQQALDDKRYKDEMNASFYLFIRSYKYGKCILKPMHYNRMND